MYKKDCSKNIRLEMQTCWNERKLRIKKYGRGGRLKRIEFKNTTIKIYHEIGKV